jgi:hypothetical protein
MKYKAHVFKYENVNHFHTGHIMCVYGAISGTIYDITIICAWFI